MKVVLAEVEMGTPRGKAQLPMLAVAAVSDDVASQPNAACESR